MLPKMTTGISVGHVVSDWRRNVSTHCCMESISVTIKTVSAMVALKPVITPAYFDAYLSSALKVRVLWIMELFVDVKLSCISLIA